MTKWSFLILLFITAASSQSWKTVSFDSDVSFEFPANHVEKDSSNFKIFSARTSEGSFSASKTIEKNLHVLSWDKWGIVELYKSFKDSIFEASGGEMLEDEVVEFRKHKASRFIISKLEDNQYRNCYYLVFYEKGHLYTFKFIERSDKLKLIYWNNRFYNGIFIRQSHKEPLPETEASIQNRHSFIPFMYLPVVLVPLTVLITVLILWSRQKGNKKKSLM